MTVKELLALPIDADNDVLRVGDEIVDADMRAVRDWANKLARCAGLIDEVQRRAQVRAERERRMLDKIAAHGLIHVDGVTRWNVGQGATFARTPDGLPVVLHETIYNTAILIRPAKCFSEVGAGPEVVGRSYGGRKWRTFDQARAEIGLDAGITEWRVVGSPDAE